MFNFALEGYSWKTNQHGLGFESVVAYELVKPDGQVVKVTEQSDAQLFFGLKVIPHSFSPANFSS